jgi:5-formyltetrahydrofolate cyclo-ligase
MGDTKANIRARAASRRDALSGSDRELKSRLIQDRALGFPLYVDAPAVALYSAASNEVGTEAIREHAFATGKQLFFPRLDPNGGFQWVRLQGREQLSIGRYGILEPAGDEILAPATAGALVVFVPGLAFDLRGNRLGRGQGWYDRALAALANAARTVALAYEFQIVDCIPTDIWDRRVEYIISEERVVDCRRLASGPGRSRNLLV